MDGSAIVYDTHIVSTTPRSQDKRSVEQLIRSKPIVTTARAMFCRVQTFDCFDLSLLRFPVDTQREPILPTDSLNRNKRHVIPALGFNYFTAHADVVLYQLHVLHSR